MSNLFKSGFVSFASDQTLVVDANNNKIIKAIDAGIEEQIVAGHMETEQNTMEEALAEALILDAELEGADFGGEKLLLSQESEVTEESDDSFKADELIRLAQVEADSIIEKAHDEAEHMRATAYDEAVLIKEQAQKDGYEDGYQSALNTLSKEFEQKEQALLQKQLQLDESFQLKEKQLVLDTEKHMVEVLCHLIPSITGVVIEDQKKVLLYMINVSMRNLENSKQFVIKVSSEDYENVIAFKDEIYGALNPSVKLEIFEDAKLSSLQCMIETDHGIVDLSLDVQLRNLLNALRLMIKE